MVESGTRMRRGWLEVLGWLKVFTLLAALVGVAAADGMPAEQLIALLQQQPEKLALLKSEAAKRAGVAADSITDEAVFSRIRGDESLRSRLTEEFRRERASSEKPDSGNTPSSVQRPPATAAPTGSGEGGEEPLVARANPYPGIASLDDLYLQLSGARAKLTRFGTEMFRLGTGNVNELPADLPAGPDYVLGPGDSLVITMWGGQSDRLERTIDRQGQVALPEAGTIAIAGMSITQAQAAIERALESQFKAERVEISLGKVRTVRVYVVGDVQRPGAYDVSSLSTPLNALYAAGGPTAKGSLRTLRQYRGKLLVREFDLYDFLLRGVRSEADRLLPGDTILVPPVGAQIAVAGTVRRPAIYELQAEQSLGDVLDLAGGVLVSATLREIKVERIEAHQRRTMLSVEVPEGAGSMGQKLAGFLVQDGDQVTVSPILPYNERAVYLDGHVFRPGKYPYREGMTVVDLLHSYQDVMPEPANHAEIVRLRPPDLRPETIAFNLSAALTGGSPVLLEPFDLVRIYSRYEFDAPKVSIHGEVLRPGEYPLAEGMTFSRLVQMAGGFKRSAYRQEADLFSYIVQNGETVLTRSAVVAIEKAMDGVQGADVALKAGDVVGIRQLTGWQDIGASVGVTGEVRYAGTYGIEAGERLSSVLKRAGGFRPGAYPSGAVLERVQVRELAEKNRQEMIRKVESSTPSVKAGMTSVQEQLSLQQAAQQQQQQVLASLRSHPVSGRLVIKISVDIEKWENSAVDVELRAGDVLYIPKRPNFVAVSGQVYNNTAITYVPGKDAGWYLRQAGGVTRAGDRRAAFILRANGTVVGHGADWFSGDALSLHLQPGDSVIVPEKIEGGSQRWKNLLATAQLMSSVAIMGSVTGAF